MSITLTIATIAACMIGGTIIGKREQDKRGIRPIASGDIDSCITVYADEERCECDGDRVSAVVKNGKPYCTGCKGRIW